MFSFTSICDWLLFCSGEILSALEGVFSLCQLLSALEGVFSLCLLLLHIFGLRLKKRLTLVPDPLTEFFVVKSWLDAPLTWKLKNWM